ncbi:MAG: dNTP triphosphohydrolase [Betaproteobacteria bacterium]|nr:MAG: dNTP triphosphohydrolase [Betaproteobacteria bacterium]
MNWRQLLCRHRLGAIAHARPPANRTDFERDYDRVVFSSAFRRLQDKTQVFPLGRNDYVRTRLTHSLEVASVGRSLGLLAGRHVLAQHPGLREEGFAENDFGAIVAAASLAHDIGNPPFGHEGEGAIQGWFKNSPAGRAILGRLAGAERADFELFEGNAQGFRTLVRLQLPDNPGGMQLCCATLGAFTKYPRASVMTASAAKGQGGKKHGFFDAERSLFEALAAELGLLRRAPGEAAWCRHPLAFLVEAADDICYRVVDVEDGFRAGQLEFGEIEPLLLAIAAEAPVRKRVRAMSTDEKRVEYLRARAIGALIEEVAAAFAGQSDAMLAGEFDRDLASVVPHAEQLEAMRALAERRVYGSAPAREARAPGVEVLGELLAAFVGAVDAAAADPGALSARFRSVFDMIPDQFLAPQRAPAADLYARVLGITDYVSGMTDSYAVAMRERLAGL